MPVCSCNEDKIAGLGLTTKRQAPKRRTAVWVTLAFQSFTHLFNKRCMPPLKFIVCVSLLCSQRPVVQQQASKGAAGTGSSKAGGRSGAAQDKQVSTVGGG